MSTPEEKLAAVFPELTDEEVEIHIILERAAIQHRAALTLQLRGIFNSAARVINKQFVKRKIG